MLITPFRLLADMIISVYAFTPAPPLATLSFSPAATLSLLIASYFLHFDCWHFAFHAIRRHYFSSFRHRAATAY